MEYVILEEDEVEKRIEYERAIAKAFAGLRKNERTWNYNIDFEQFTEDLTLTDDIAKAMAFAGLREEDRKWDDFESFGEEVLKFLNNDRSKAIAFAAVLINDDLPTLENFNSLNLKDEKAKAIAFAAVLINGDLPTLENFNSLNLKEEKAKAIAFAGLKQQDKTWKNFNSLNLGEEKAKAIAFAGLKQQDKTWKNFNSLNLKDEKAKAIAFAAVVNANFDFADISEDEDEDDFFNEEDSLEWKYFQRLNLKDEKAKATAFAAVVKKEFNNAENSCERNSKGNLINPLYKECEPFNSLNLANVLYKEWKRFNSLNLTDEKAKATAFASIAPYATCNHFESLKLTEPKAKATAFASLHYKYKTKQNFLKVFGQKSPARIGGGVTLGILTALAVVLLFLHIFCPPAAVAIDGALVTVGIGGGAAAIVVPVTAGGIGLGSGVLSGMLFHKCLVFPEASNNVKLQIQQRKQSLSLAIGNTGNFQTNEQNQSQQRSNENDKPSVLNDLIPNATTENQKSSSGIDNEQINKQGQNKKEDDLDLGN